MELIMYLVQGIYLLLLYKPTSCLECNDPVCELVHNLTHNYWKDIMPKCNHDPILPVRIELWLRQVVDLVEPKQILSTNVWIRIDWYDCRLSWNPEDYIGTDLIYFPYDSIWTPDVTLYDDSAFGSNVAMSERKFYRLEVNSNGRVKQKFPTVLKSVCGVDATYFPFDKQSCPLRFGPWVYDDTKVNLTTDRDGKTTAYLENAEWVLLSLKSENMVSKYNHHSFTEVTFTVEVQRRPAFFMLTLFFPCFLICTMAVIGFILPPSSGQKVGLQLTLLLSLTVFEFLTLGLVPPNSKPLPLMCVYFALVMILASLSCLLSVVVLKVYLKGKEGWKVSPKVRSLLIDGLGRLLFVKRPHMLREHAEEDLKRKSTLSNGRVSGRPSENQDSSHPEIRNNLNALHKIAERLGELVQHVEEEKAEKESAEYQDWMTVASVLDRLFLILYVLLSFIIFVAFSIKLTS